MQTISARQLQREYKKVLEKAKQLKEPIVVISNNKPQGAVIGLELLEKIQLDLVAEEALKEQSLGKTRSIKNDRELNRYLKVIEKSANGRN